MELEYRCNPRLPKLSWLADCDRSTERVLVEHGPYVEVREHFFIEGAWNGDFATGDFASTECVFGSGGVIMGQSIVFVASCATTDALFYRETGQRVTVSNSLPFLLAANGDELDPGFTGYHEHNESILLGIEAYDRKVRTKRGEVNHLFFRNLRITGVGCEEVTKRLPPRFVTFEDYYTYLDQNYREIVVNIRSPERRTRVDILSTQSRGYDTSAINALASQYGIDRVFTCKESKSADPFAERRNIGNQDDDGTEICKVLGLDCVSINRRAYQNGFAEEYLYYASQDGNQDANLLEINAHVENVCVLLTGVLGEMWYEKSAHESRPLNYVASDLKRWDLCGHGLTEVRLRVGFIQLPMPYMGAQRREDVYRISNSPEMAEWRINAKYDRPIPRRIAEERGVPRGLFGQVKLASAVVFPKPPLPYGKELRRRFLNYLVDNKITTRWQTRLWPVIQLVNMVLETRSPQRFRAVYYLDRVISKMTVRPFVFKQWWARLNGSLFCFCVNMCVHEYVGWSRLASRAVMREQLVPGATRTVEMNAAHSLSVAER